MNPCRVLIVEDEAIVAMDIEERLTSLGYQPEGYTASAEQALAMVERQRPDLVLMDIHLQGGMDGIAAAHEIRNRFQVPVVFITAYSEEATLDRAKLAEPYGYILKPFTDRELRCTLEVTLYKHGAEQKILRLTRLYDLLSQVNQAIVRIPSRDELLAAVCRRVVECSDIDLAWIGRLDSTLTTITPVTYFGLHDGVPHQIELSDQVFAEGHSHPGSAIQDGQPFVCNKCPDKFCAFPTLAIADRFGCHACGWFPLRLQGEVWGVLSLFTARPGFFRDKEVELLKEVAADISFALDKIASDTQRRQAETERSRMEAQLRQAQKMEALGTLAGGIAHDFNNILGIIVGYADMAYWETAESSPIRRQLQQVLKAANRAKELVRQILAFSRRSDQSSSSVEVGLIVKEVMKMLRASLPTTIEIRTNVTSKAQVQADPSQLHQLLLNLCTNASHAMRDNGGTLSVTLADVQVDPQAIPPHTDRQPGPHLQLTVQDTGQGIDPIILERIFDPFFTTKEPGVGTGLGLAVVHGIVTGLRGAIEVASDPGQGTTFQVLLPARQAAGVKETPQTTAPAGGKERILFVEDELQLAQVAQQMLERLGYEVEYQTDGIEALQSFHRNLPGKPFDLVITDMTMPRLTGVELAARLHQLQPQLPVILCTGFSEKISPEKTRNLGIQGLLMKPFTWEQLAEMIREVLQGSTPPTH